MNAERLLQLYDRVSEAPDAIPRLRRFILDLAMRGKLVKQDPDDEPVSDMLKRIEIDRQHRGKARKVRKSSGDGNLGHVPHPIPPNWRWLPLGDLGYTQTGATPPKSHPEHYGDYIPFLRPGNLFESYVDYSGGGLSAVGIKASGRLAQPGSVLMVCIGTIGKCQILDRPASFNQQINSISPYADTNPHFLLRMLQAPYFQDAAWNASARTTIAILNKSNWEKIPVPLAPLAEQHRIVAKVDELMTLCDSLEAEREKRETARDRLTTASLSRLTAPSVDENQFKAHADFAINVLPELTTRPDQLKVLRQTILDLAVRGKLVEQDLNDEPASELHRRITVEKAGNGKRQKSVPEIAADALGIIPENWCVVPLIALGQWALGAGFPKNEQGRTEGAYFFLKVSDMNLPGNEKYIIEANNHIDESAATRMRVKIHPPGTIIFPKIGGAIATNKRRMLTRSSAIDNNCLGITFSSQVNLDWAYLFLTTLDFAKFQAGTAVPALQQSTLEKIPVALPPLTEQKRIVAKSDKLMAVCDQLERSLVYGQGVRSRLLEEMLT